MPTPWRATTIAIDFDRTFTSDIDMWRHLIWVFFKRGHVVWLVTGRHHTPENRQLVQGVVGSPWGEFLTGSVFCDHRPKRDVTRELGIMIDVWIDDLPELIGHADREVFAQLEAQQPIAETLPVLEPGAVSPTSCWKPE